MAISDFDKNNNARSERDKIKTALEKLLEFYDCKGQGYDLYLPLIGTGRSRAGLSHQESFDLIKEVLVDKLNNGNEDNRFLTEMVIFFVRRRERKRWIRKIHC